MLESNEKLIPLIPGFYWVPNYESFVDLISPILAPTFEKIVKRNQIVGTNYLIKAKHLMVPTEYPTIVEFSYITVDGEPKVTMSNILNNSELKVLTSTANLLLNKLNNQERDADDDDYRLTLSRTLYLSKLLIKDC